ncbi:MAG TPA: biosynthetic peptidoglycan transglycosylase [Myxococcaceae bacterium]|jgi:hypothetical protein
MRRAGAVAAAVVAVVVLGVRAVEVSGATREWVHRRLAAELTSRFPGATVGDRVEIGWLGDVTAGPVEVPNLLTADEVRVRPRYRALLAGRAEPDLIWIHELHLRVDALRQSGPAGSPSSPEGPRRSTSSVTVQVDRVFLSRGEALLFAPVAVRATIRRAETGAIAAWAWATFADGGTARAWLEYEKDRRAALSLELRRVGTGALSEDVLWRIPVGTLQGGASLDARVVSGDGLATFTAEWSLRAEDVVVAGRKLAVRPVGPMTAGFQGKAHLDVREKHLEVGPAELWLGAARVSLAADLRAGDVPSKVELRAGQVSYRDLVEALPEELRPVAEAPHCGGPLSGFVSVQGPLTRPTEWEVNGKLDVSQVRLAHKAPRPFLLDAFEYKTVGRTTWIGPESPTFVPIRDLPIHVTRAITISEDASFYAHRGFDLDEIRASITRALRKGTRVRGASTITQQLTKNLFLSGERTYARKAREALITIALEATVPKERLLEVYLNLIEWGPDVYGIGEAAQHYFGVDARQLTAKQAAFLGTIIPNPVKYHFLFERGEITPIWEQHVADVLIAMHENEYLDDTAYQAAMAEPLTFRRDELAGGGG